MNRISDPDFGMLDVNHIFDMDRPYEVELFGSKQATRLSARGRAREAAITDYQRRAFLQLEREKARFCRETEEALMKYYDSIGGEEYGEYTALDGTVHEELPPISHRNELGSIIELTGIFLRDSADKEQIEFQFECSWIDLGLAVKFVNGQFVEVGDQGMMF